jgi:hypothetical protein
MCISNPQVEIHNELIHLINDALEAAVIRGGLEAALALSPPSMTNEEKHLTEHSISQLMHVENRMRKDIQRKLTTLSTAIGKN